MSLSLSGRNNIPVANSERERPQTSLPLKPEEKVREKARGGSGAKVIDRGIMHDRPPETVKWKFASALGGVDEKKNVSKENAKKEKKEKSRASSIQGSVGADIFL